MTVLQAYSFDLAHKYHAKAVCDGQTFTQAEKAVFTLAMSRLIYLPWPLETILPVSRHQGGQGKSSQVMLPVAVAGSFTNKCRQCK